MQAPLHAPGSLAAAGGAAPARCMHRSSRPVRPPAPGCGCRHHTARVRAWAAGWGAPAAPAQRQTQSQMRTQPTTCSTKHQAKPVARVRMHTIALRRCAAVPAHRQVVCAAEEACEAGCCRCACRQSFVIERLQVAAQLLNKRGRWHGQAHATCLRGNAGTGSRQQRPGQGRQRE